MEFAREVYYFFDAALPFRSIWAHAAFWIAVAVYCSVLLIGIGYDIQLRVRIRRRLERYVPEPAHARRPDDQDAWN